MKKTLAIVMALAMALGMIASFAFVAAPTTTSRTNAPIGIDMWATDAMATTQGTRIWTDFVDKSEDLYPKSSLIYFVMQIRAYNSVQNADVLPSYEYKLMDVTLTSPTVDLSLSGLDGGTVVTAISGANINNVFSGLLRTSVSSDANKLQAVTFPGNDFFENKGNNTYAFKVAYKNIPYVNGAANAANACNVNRGDLVPHTIAIDIQEGTAGIAAYSDYYLGFVGLTKNEITAKGSVVANINYDGSSECFHNDEAGKVNVTDPYANGKIGDWLKVTKGDRTYLIVRSTADTWAPKTSYMPDYLGTNKTVKQSGYAVFVQANPAGIYNYIAQLDTEVTAVEGYGQSLGISVDPYLFSKNSNGNTDHGFGNIINYYKNSVRSSANLIKVLPYTFMTTKYVLAEDAQTEAGAFKAGQDAFNAAQLAAFETFMSDFGFSAANTYKLQDKDFTVTGAYQATITAEYNGGQVVPIEPEDDDSEIVDEGTDEIEEEPDVKEEPDVEEEPDVDEEPEVPAETGDFSSDVAIVLAVSALAAAAALAFVMKKVRD